MISFQLYDFSGKGGTVETATGSVAARGLWGEKEG